MEQLLLELVPPEPPSFDNYLPGPNSEVVAALEQRLAQQSGEAVIYLWGPSAAGKSHLLGAALGKAGGMLVKQGVSLPSADPPGLLAVDDVESLDTEGQAWLFSQINARRESGRWLLVAGARPPAQLAMREDVRSRLAWGLVFELKALADEDKPMALLAYAEARGIAATPKVIAYLLGRGRRDMGTLVRLLATLDHVSLLEKRPITVALAQRLMRVEKI